MMIACSSIQHVMQAKFGEVVAVVVVVISGLIQDHNETLEKDGQDYLGNALCIQLCCYFVHP